MPLDRGARGDAFRRAVSDEVLPALADFAPELLLLSAGFDAHLADSLGGMKVSNDDFAWLGEALVGFAARQCRGRLVSVLEGGYNPKVVASVGADHVAALMAAATVAPALMNRI